MLKVYLSKMNKPRRNRRGLFNDDAYIRALAIYCFMILNDCLLAVITK
jgi:hypothetical protein